MNQRTAVRESIDAIDRTPSPQRWPSGASPHPPESAPSKPSISSPELHPSESPRTESPRSESPRSESHRTESHRAAVYFETADAHAGFFLKCAVEANGYRVYRAVNRTELYRLVLTVNPALIVLGATEGKREAIELIGDLRDIPSLDDVPVVLFADGETERSVRLAFAMGATRYILRSPVESERAACILALLSGSEDSDSRIDAYEILPGERAASAAFSPSQLARPPVKAAMAPDGHGASRYPWIYRRFAEARRLNRDV